MFIQIREVGDSVAAQFTGLKVLLPGMSFVIAMYLFSQPLIATNSSMFVAVVSIITPLLWAIVLLAACFAYLLVMTKPNLARKELRIFIESNRFLVHMYQESIERETIALQTTHQGWREKVRKMRVQTYENYREERLKHLHHTLCKVNENVKGIQLQDTPANKELMTEYLLAVAEAEERELELESMMLPELTEEDFEVITKNNIAAYKSYMDPHLNTIARLRRKIMEIEYSISEARKMMQ
jgi:hypothetical protein